MKNFTHKAIEDYTTYLLKYKSLNKKINTIENMVTSQNKYKIHLLKSIGIVGLNILFMRTMFKVFKMDRDSSEIIALIETASNIITVYKILQKLGS